MRIFFTDGDAIINVGHNWSSTFR